MDDVVEALARRATALERELRWHRAAVALGVALLAGTGLASGHAGSRAATPELQARRFVLVGADGAPLAALEPTADAASRLVLLGRAGAPRLTLALAADGSPSVALSDASGRPRVLLDAAGEEARVSVTGLDRSMVLLANGGIAPRLALLDTAGKERVWLALRLNSPALQFLDGRGVARSGLTTFNDDAGVAIISGTDGKSPGLVLYGKDRSIVWSAP
jgi:hypothetical protein